MKKAYVKPVFLAEVFEGTASVATCTQDYDPTKNLMQVYNGLRACEHTNNGHEIGKGQAPVNNYWSYATNGSSDNPTKAVEDLNEAAFLFTSGQQECDFVWNSYDGGIGVWYDKQDQLQANKDDRDVSLVESIIKTVANDFMSFFRGNGSKCTTIEIDGVTPFSN